MLDEHISIALLFFQEVTVFLDFYLYVSSFHSFLLSLNIVPDDAKIKISSRVPISTLAVLSKYSLPLFPLHIFPLAKYHILDAVPS